MSTINLVNNTTENNITLSRDRVSIEANVKTRITANTKVNLEVSQARGPAGQDGADGTSYTANNGIAIISDVIQLGSDSLSDDKGSELTHDTYIHLNGFSQVFKGSLFGNDSILEIGPDGGMTFDRTSAETGTPTTYMMKYKALTDSHYFNICQSSTNGGAGVYNNVFIMGWNLTPGGGAEDNTKTGIGFSFEDNYEPELGFQMAEFHTFFVDYNGTQNRLESTTIIKNDPTRWDKYYTLANMYCKSPSTQYDWLNFQNSGSISKMVLSEPTITGGGVQLAVDKSQNYFKIQAEGMYAGIDNISGNIFEIIDFGSFKSPIFDAVRYNGDLVWIFKDRLLTYSDNATAKAAGWGNGTLYKTATGDLKVVIP